VVYFLLQRADVYYKKWPLIAAKYSGVCTAHI
jgi:hypothetical protein